MRRLDGLSAFLLACEQPGAYQHTLKIGIYDTTDTAGGWSYQNFRDDLERHLSLAPILRWKLQRVPLNIHRPVWVDDPDFDIDYHLRHIVCPAPGDNRALCALISQLYAWPLDFSKPLWLMWFTEGLPNGQVALITLLHHAYTDGTGASRAMERFLATRPQAEPPVPVTPVAAPPWRPEPVPGKLQLVLSSLRDIPLSIAQGIPTLVHGIRELRRLRRRYARASRELPPDPFRDSRDSPFNVRLTHGRTFVFETYPLERMRDIARGLQVTINDLLLAASSTVYREFMRERGFDPDKGPLVATIPFQRRRPKDQDDFIGNQTTADYMWLPVHIADPLERLRATKHSCEVMKEHIKAAAGADTLSLLEIVPPVMLRLPDWIVMHNKRSIGLDANVLMSNVVGPREPLYWGQRRLANWISMGQVRQGMGINVTVWTYTGNFNLCIMADKKLLPDGWAMMERFREAFAEYERLAAQSAGTG